MSIYEESYFKNLTVDQLVEQVDKAWPDIKALCDRIKTQERYLQSMLNINELLLNNRNSDYSPQWHVFEIYEVEGGYKGLKFYCACETEANADQISFNAPFNAVVYRSDDSAILTFGGEQ